MKRLTIILLSLTVVAVVLVFLVFIAIERITPVEMTKSAIIEPFVRISTYARTHRAVPLSLDILPKRKGYANRATDGWGRPLQYRVASDGVITLTSLQRRKTWRKW